MSLVKAKIELLYGDNVSAPLVKGFPLDVQFNPTEFTLSKGAQFAEINIPGLDSPILQFVRGQNEKLTLDLFFDRTLEKGLGDSAADVRELTNPIYQLVKIQSSMHAPPRIRIVWGKALSFQAVVESVQQKFTLFSPNGTPLRATVSVSLREYKTLREQLKELNLLSPDHTKTRVVKQSETLAKIAYEEYGDPSLWRFIADEPANRAALPDPARPAAGVVLAIPKIDPSDFPARERRSR